MPRNCRMTTEDCFSKGLMLHEFKRLSGIFMLVLAFLCSPRTPEHLHSKDAYFHALGYVDSAITLLLLVPGLYLVLSPRRTPPMRPSKQNPVVPALLAATKEARRRQGGRIFPIRFSKARNISQ